MIAIASHTLRANGIRQNFIDSGAGAPVVLLHGFPETNYAWRNQIPVLGELYRIIAPDLPETVIAELLEGVGGRCFEDCNEADSGARTTASVRSSHSPADW